jgi:5-methylthioadenosine/S-adenosylhomocysteine deaminase
LRLCAFARKLFVMSSILIKNGTVVTMDTRDSIVQGDILIADGRIAEVGGTGQTADTIIDATDCAVIPGFVQTHIHLCQTIFRGAADDLALIDWLKQRVWPMEAAHSAESIAASARLGIAELIKGGTTCALTMETVNHTAEVFKVVEETGFRATVGKCMMDKGDEVPLALREQTDNSIDESLALLEAWHGKADGRIKYCFAPRFAISCTQELLQKVAGLARERGVMIHTHASENRTECELVQQETGLRNIAYLDSVGLTGRHVALAHCVHLSVDEIETLRTTGTNVVHCPSSNLKLGSGIAPVAKLLEQGISVSLGADGAACNNRLDMFTEMRTAALLQKVLHGPEVLPASRALRMATMDGAQALGLSSEIGSLEAGKRADLAIVRLDRLHATPANDVVSALVYSAEANDVETVLINGELVMRDRKLLSIAEGETIEGISANKAALKELCQLEGSDCGGRDRRPSWHWRALSI